MKNELRIPLVCLSPLLSLEDSSAGILFKQLYKAMEGMGIECTDNPIIEVMKNQILTHNVKQREHDARISRIRSKAGQAGGLARAANAVSDTPPPPPPQQETLTEPEPEIQPEPEPTPEPAPQQETEQETEQEQEATPKPKKVFTPPTPEEVNAYLTEWCATKGYSYTPDEAQKLCYFYESKGWMVGSNKMKDWQSAARGWILRLNQQEKKQASSLGREDISSKQFTEF